VQNGRHFVGYLYRFLPPIGHRTLSVFCLYPLPFLLWLSFLAPYILPFGPPPQYIIVWTFGKKICLLPASSPPDYLFANTVLSPPLCVGPFQLRVTGRLLHTFFFGRFPPPLGCQAPSLFTFGLLARFCFLFLIIV